MAGKYNGWPVSKEKTPRATGPKPGAPENEHDLEKERRGLRDLIGSFRQAPESGEDGGFYRNIGRFIVRPLMKWPSPGDENH